MSMSAFIEINESRINYEIRENGESIVGVPPYQPIYQEEEVHVPVKHGAQVVIDEDMPSHKGAHLLGHEGELAVEVKYEVRRRDSGKTRKPR